MVEQARRPVAGRRAWARGERIEWVYRNPMFPGLVELRPVTVVDHREDRLVVWLASGTPILRPVLADGSDLRSVEGRHRFADPRAQARGTWRGPGILAVFQPGAMYSVWFFESRSGRRDSYYVNLETPYARTDDGIESADLVLDIVVRADRSHVLKDEDELEFAREAGRFTDVDVAAIRAAAAEATRRIEAWGFPFDAGFEDFVPDPAWAAPGLPDGATWSFELPAEDG